MSFIQAFEKIAAIPNRLEGLKKFFKGSNPVANFLNKRKLEQHELNATRMAFKNPSKASALMDKADTYKKVKESL
jgi:hypothetical protein